MAHDYDSYQPASDWDAYDERPDAAGYQGVPPPLPERGCRARLVEPPWVVLLGLIFLTFPCLAVLLFAQATDRVDLVEIARELNAPSGGTAPLVEEPPLPAVEEPLDEVAEEPGPNVTLPDADDPAGAADLLNAGRAALRAGRADEAIELLEEATERVPGNPLILSDLGDAYHYAGRLDASIEAYSAALQLAPGDNRLLYKIGRSYAQQGQYGQAVDFYERSMRTDAHYPPVYLGLGIAYNETGRTGEAIAALQRFLQISDVPENRALGEHYLTQILCAPDAPSGAPPPPRPCE